MRQHGKRLKEKELIQKLLWNEGVAESPFEPSAREEKAIGHN
jgi:hypothetical protein